MFRSSKFLLVLMMKSSANALRPNPGGMTTGQGARGAAAASRGAPGMIKMILSPAKTLDLSPWPKSKNEDSDDDDDETQYKNHGLLIGHTTRPDCSIEKTRSIANAMKKYKTPSELAKLLGISANLATTAWQFWNDFQLPPCVVGENEKPCIYAFSGAAYQGLDIATCTNHAILYLQDHLRIIDPVYGTLRPLDQIQPYRLEMATKGLRLIHDNDGATNRGTGTIKLVDYWKASVTARLKEELVHQAAASGSVANDSNEEHPASGAGDVLLLNLASDEYSAAVSAKDLPETVRYIKVIFLEQGRVVAVHAKRARGLMVRYLAERQATTLGQVKAFSVEGYALVEQHDDGNTLIFDREKQTTATANRGGSAAAATKKKVAATKKSSTYASAPRAKRSKR
jgi:uncharacterized protein